MKQLGHDRKCSLINPYIALPFPGENCTQRCLRPHPDEATGGPHSRNNPGA